MCWDRLNVMKNSASCVRVYNYLLFFGRYLLAEKMRNETDPGEKSKIAQQIQQVEQELKCMRNELSTCERMLKENDKKLEQIFDDLGKYPHLTQEQVMTKSNSVDLGA